VPLTCHVLDRASRVVAGEVGSPCAPLNVISPENSVGHDFYGDDLEATGRGRQVSARKGLFFPRDAVRRAPTREQASRCAESAKWYAQGVLAA